MSDPGMTDTCVYEVLYRFSGHRPLSFPRLVFAHFIIANPAPANNC